MEDWRVKSKSITFNPAFRSELRVLQRFIIEDLANLAYVTLEAYLDTGRSDWPVISEATKWLKGSDKLLVDSGDFKRALDIQVDDNRALVGILTPRGSQGQDLEMIARVIQEGAIIQVSEKMRRWFAWKGMPLRRTTMHIVIPPRPLFEPTLAEIDEEIDGIVNNYMDDILGAI